MSSSSTQSNPKIARRRTPVLRLIRGLAQRNYRTAKAVFQWDLHRTCLRVSEPPILIYQMGKVGSATMGSSIREGLTVSGRSRPIWHAHAMSDDRLAYNEAVYRRIFRDASIPADKRNPGHHWRAEFLRGRLSRPFNGKKWSIVTLVRDPIARNISSFFQVLDFDVGYDYSEKIKTTPMDTIQAELQELFWQQSWHRFPIQWFDREVKPITGIDVFASAFPREKGYQTAESDSCRMLVLRLEDIDRTAAPGLQEFLGIQNFRMLKANISENKDYATIYNAFRTTVNFSDKYLDCMYNSPFSRHFYSAEELDRFRARWAPRNSPLVQ